MELAFLVKELGENPGATKKKTRKKTYYGAIQR